MVERVWHWLTVDTMWVDDRLRGQGFGTAVLEAVGARARALGRRWSDATTFDFQAPGFHQRRDYEEYGVTATPAGYTGEMSETVHGPPGYIQNKQDQLKRLRRIEGQIRGLQRMVEDEKYCIDILTQVSAATRALESVALSLLDDHLRHCMVGPAEEGTHSRQDHEAKIAEASAAIARLVRS